MKGIVRNKVFMTSILLAATLVLAAPFAATCFGFSITVDVSPNQVNIQSQGSPHTVRVLTSMSYGSTGEVRAYVNGEFIPSTKTRDSVGHLIVKFLISDLRVLPGLVVNGENSLLIEGMTDDPEFPQPFDGEGLFTVVAPQGR